MQSTRNGNEIDPKLLRQAEVHCTLSEPSVLSLSRDATRSHSSNPSIPPEPLDGAVHPLQHGNAQTGNICRREKSLQACKEQVNILRIFPFPSSLKLFSLTIFFDLKTRIINIYINFISTLKKHLPSVSPSKRKNSAACLRLLF